MKWKIYKLCRLYLIAWSSVITFLVLNGLVTRYALFWGDTDWILVTSFVVAVAVLPASIFKPTLRNHDTDISIKQKVTSIASFCVLFAFIGWVLLLLIFVYIPLGNFAFGLEDEKWLDNSIIIALLCAIILLVFDILLLYGLLKDKGRVGY